jgi:thymidylate synthase (FAD)
MKTEVLDHGFVELVEAWGSDESIIEAARMSTQKGFLGWGPSCSKCGVRIVATDDGPSPADYERGEQRGCDHDDMKAGDEKLLRYLYEHKHSTPFEMAGCIIEVQAPIFIFREWHRHRTQSYAEMSARYSPLPDVNYVPQVERLLMTGGANKQAGGTGATLDADTARRIQAEIKDAYAAAETTYQRALATGTPKELARLILPVGRYSRMRASANLRNWLGFLTLRMDPAAQWEIRQYANAVAGILRDRFPRTMELFDGGAR